MTSAYGYLGFTTLQTYDTQACASKCDKMNGCMAVNVYFERDPSVDPGTNCPSPSSVTMIKCVFWGGPVTSANANNQGQCKQRIKCTSYLRNRLIVPAYCRSPELPGRHRWQQWLREQDTGYTRGLHRPSVPWKCCH